MSNEAQQRVPELRDRFFQKLQDDGPPDNRDFHPVDINRIKNSDDWLRRFIEHHDNNISAALTMLWECCEWRRNFGTNDLNLNNVRRDYLDEGVCFSHGKDKDGKTLFVIKSKLHTKGARDFLELQKVIIYWFERLERETKGNQISLFFDMVDAGLSNLDMELTKYLIGLFKNYYPNFLNLIIILEMPWVLNAAFTIIKSWLPAKAIPKIKFVKKSTLKEYVHPDVALKCWGGNNDYMFVFIPESSSKVNNENIDKKVQFAELSPMTDQPSYPFNSKSKSENPMLSIDPDVLVFNKVDNDVIGNLTLKNISEAAVSYKIKTTALEKFKVRPSKGVLTPNQTFTINIMLQPGFKGNLHSDRFLVLCLPILDPKMSNQELIDFWTNNGTNAEQHRLICRDGTENADALKSNMASYNDMQGGNSSINSLFNRITRMEELQIVLQKDISMFKKLLLFFMCVIGLLLLYIIYLLNAVSISNVPTERSIPSISIEKHDDL